MISVNIATHEAREPFLPKCLSALLEQNTLPDVINVYLNDYAVQPWQKKLENETVVNFIDGGDDLGASAKFWFADSQTEGVYITLDDDLIASKGYVGYLADAAYRYPNSIVGLHGTIYHKWPVESYYLDPEREVFYCYAAKGKDEAVQMLGSGAIAFRVKQENAPTLDHFPERNMTNPFMYNWGAETEKSFVCLHRGDKLVKEQTGSQETAIWKGLLKDDSKQTEIINRKENRLIFRNKNHEIIVDKLGGFKFGGAAIEWSHMKKLLSIIGPETKVVEFGSGLSTAVLRKVCKNVTSFEHDEKWAKGETLLRPLDPKTGWYSVTKEDKKLIKDADIVFIDGPIGSQGGRYKLPFDLIGTSCTLVVDDCQRPPDNDQAAALAAFLGVGITFIEGIDKIIAIIK